MTVLYLEALAAIAVSLSVLMAGAFRCSSEGIAPERSHIKAA